MGLDPHNFSSFDLTCSDFNAKVLLYNLGVGCSDLQFVYEKHPNFSVFPTFPIRLGGAGAWDRFPRTTVGLNIDGER